MLKRKSSRSRPLILLRAMLAIVVLAFGGWFLAWGAAQLLVVEVPLEHADAILVMSGARRVAERNHFAADVFRQGRAPRIILTNDLVPLGWDSKEQRNPLAYEWARRILEGDGVPPDRIEVLMEPVTGTYEELELVGDYVKEHQVHSLLVVTSAYHSRRTKWTIEQIFKGTGVQVGVMTASPTLSPWSWWLHRSGWEMVAGEYVKMAYYWISF
jgi:uncharacterized SAM-binding protein YcdF (DUF218 family)